MGSDEHGTLPDGFTFGAPSDKDRTPFIKQWKIYEQCKGDLECIQAIRAIQQAVLHSHTSAEIHFVNGSTTTNIVQENHVSQGSKR
jgi:hypothetical protein